MTKHFTISIVLFLLAKISFGQVGYTEKGNASFYAQKFNGRKTACGEKYDAKQLTAAHRTLPFQCIVKVKNLKNDKEVIVRINDRGPFSSNKIIDLSPAAAKKLDIIQEGFSMVKLEVIALNGEFPLNNDSMCIRDTDLLRLNQIEDFKNNKIFDLEGKEAKPTGYGVQVGAYMEEKNVLKLYLSLEQKELKSVYTEVKSGYKKKHYKIIIGEYKSYEEAETYKAILKGLGFEGYIKKYE